MRKSEKRNAEVGKKEAEKVRRWEDGKLKERTFSPCFQPVGLTGRREERFT
jgi:hypothetical protein